MFHRKGHCCTVEFWHLLHLQGKGGIWCLINLAVVNLAVGNLVEAPGFSVINLADTPRKQA